MSMTDYRAMCAELHTAIQLYTGQNPAAANVPPAELVCRLMDAMAASAALLAQPVAEGPTDEEIEEWADACPEAPLEERDPDVHGWRRCFTAKEFSETIRAALARFGRPTPQPVADGEVAELVEWLRESLDCALQSGNSKSIKNHCRLLDLLGRPNALPTPEAND